ncbi:SDR family NAD(P)-dependent oxidoreductase [Acetobacter okinawensis]|nr:SDR family NAD(P)-dependent oxidoreductase [Acetobacter okinawensis]
MRIMTVTPQVIMISGSARGMGAAIARKFYDEGWNVSLGMRTPKTPEWAIDDDRLLVVHYDGLDSSSEASWVAQTLAKFRRIDAVVANAGIGIWKNIIEISDQEMDDMLEVHVKSPRRLVAAAWDMLVASGRGRVVVIGSLSSKRVYDSDSGPYAVSKFATLALAHSIRHTGFEHGIRATAICPGFVRTDMVEGMMPELNMTPPQEIARIAYFLVMSPNEVSISEIPVNCRAEESF